MAGPLWPLWLLAFAILVSMVLLAVVCLQCRNRGPLVSIRQANASEDYMPSTEFHRIYPSQPNTDLNSIHHSSHLLSPFSPSADPGTQRRHRSVTPTETESNPSYENPAEDPDYVNTDSEADDPGYIIVLPDGQTPLTNQSGASTPSSDNRHDYENVPKKKEEKIPHSSSDDKDYLNVENFQKGSSSAPSDSDSDDDEGNYVNVTEGTKTEGPQ